MKDTAMKCGIGICEAVMAKYQPAAKLRQEGKFHYHQGVFLSGVEHFNRFAKREDFFCYTKDWVDSIMRPVSSIYDLDDEVMNKEHLDDLQAGILLFDLYEKTNDVFYKRILDEIIEAFDEYPCNRYGGFWHMKNLPDQMWLDGLYMAGPLLMQYGARFDRPDLFDRVVQQALLMFEHCYDEKAGLLRHGWDCEKRAEWADPETGISPEFWGRAMGWFVVALTDILELLPQSHDGYRKLSDMLCLLLKNVVRYQDKQSGMWYQVLDKGDRPDNWTEISCSMMFTMAIIRAVKRGFLSEEYMPYADKGLAAVFSQIRWSGKAAVLLGTCRGTMIGSYDYYVNRKRRANDLHGCGAFLLLMAAVLE